MVAAALAVASPPVVDVHRMADETDIVGYYVADREPGKRDVPKSFSALNDDALGKQSVVAVQGLQVSLRGFLEDLHVQDLIGDDLL